LLAVNEVCSCVTCAGENGHEASVRSNVIFRGITCVELKKGHTNGGVGDDGRASALVCHAGLGICHEVVLTK